MKLRFRFLAALFALFALVLSGVETAWASSCAPAVGAEAAASMSMSDSGMDCSAAMARAHSDESGRGHKDGPKMPHCPLGPMAAAGACVAAPSLPAHTPDMLALSTEGALLAVSPDQTRDLLLISAFFRPPRA